MRRLSTIIVLAATAAALAGGAQTASSGAFRLRGTVTYVVDGDTVHVAVAGRDERVRLIGIDTPEVGQCDSAKATALARRLAQGRPVTLVGDATQATRDRYGRLLAYVVLPGGRDLGYQELARGYGRVYVYDRPFQRRLQARGAGRTHTRRQHLARLQHGYDAVGPLRSVLSERLHPTAAARPRLRGHPVPQLSRPPTRPAPLRR
jgi:micrococcal nuclease